MGFLKRLLGLEDNTTEESPDAGTRQDIGPGPHSTGKARRETVFDPWDEVSNFRYQFFFGGLMRRLGDSRARPESSRRHLEQITREREARYQQKQSEKRLKKEAAKRTKGPE